MSALWRPVHLAYLLIALLIGLATVSITESVQRFEATSARIRQGYLRATGRVLAPLMAPAISGGSPLEKGSLTASEMSPDELDPVRILVQDRQGQTLLDTLESQVRFGQPDAAAFDRALKGEESETVGTTATGLRWSAVTVPIRGQDRILGTVTTSRSNRSIRPALDEIEEGYVAVGLALAALACLTVAGLFLYFIRPIELWLAYSGLFGGREQASRPNLRRARLGWIGRGIDRLFDALSDRRYIESMVQCLAHELKNPLAALKTTSEWFLRTAANPDSRHRAESLLLTLDRMQQTIEGVMGLAALERREALTTLTPCPVRELFEEAVQRLEGSLSSKGLNCLIELETSLSIDCDRLLMLQALGNLLQNSIDHAPRGSVITLRAKASGDRIVLEVRDQGEGIPDYAIPHLFEKFYSLKSQQSGKPGTGLGLAFVQEIADLHFGTVELLNAQEGGVVARLSVRRKS